MSKEFYSFKEAREIIGVGVKAFKGMVERGEIQATGKRIARAELERISGHPIGVDTPNTPVEDAELAEAVRQRKLADERTLEAKARREALAFSAGCQSVEELVKREKKLIDGEVALEELVNEQTMELRGKYETAIAQCEAERVELKEARLKYIPALKECISDRNKYFNRMKELEQALGIKESDEVREKSEAENYAEHRNRGATLLQHIAKNIKSYSPELATYLVKQAGLLEEEKEFKQGMQRFKICSKSLVRFAEFYQDGKFKEFDGGQIADWLARMDEKLCSLMKIVDDRDDRVDGKYILSESPMT